MDKLLNTGKGRCHGTARLLIQPMQSVIALGSGYDLILNVLNAVHHANRYGSTDDFIAVTFPAMKMGRNRMMSGFDIEMIGSNTSLSGLIALDDLQSLMQRDMILSLDITEIVIKSGMTGAAYIRDRACEKSTEGRLRRDKARAERRGKVWTKRDHPAHPDDLTTLCLRYGKVVVNVRQIIGKTSDNPLVVSTYGFSNPSADSIAVLPVYSEAERKYKHTA